MAFEVTRVETPEAMAAAIAVRKRVFVEEQRVPIEEEVDRYDHEPWRRDDVVHVVGRLDGVVIATARLLLDAHAGELPHIGRVAVLAEHRGNGHGREIMRALHEEARARVRRGHASGAGARHPVLRAPGLRGARPGVSRRWHRPPRYGHPVRRLSQPPARARARARARSRRDIASPGFPGVTSR
jgi:predicted GNAT family N-acyltransferase